MYFTCRWRFESAFLCFLRCFHVRMLYESIMLGLNWTYMTHAIIHVHYLYMWVVQVKFKPYAVASEAYHDWSGEAADAQLRTCELYTKIIAGQNFCNRHLMRFISFASNIGPTAAVPVRPVPAPLLCHMTQVLLKLRFTTMERLAGY